ncbi:hypothetical protein DSO57_1010223 [Entomophthora muscae]|uniref:Uncharacterized protein n=1 Tax=Entomophthora muscae TaxID=34485 RepID=A0ACC2S8J1_9FUNG|nr:hypothetical protein DSO57_1010223 [Entomophthora muscae]
MQLVADKCKVIPPLALDRTIFPRRSKKSVQKPAKPINSLEDLAHTINERFVLTYPSQVINTNVMNSAPTWEKSLINLDYLLAWAHPHLKLIKLNHSGCTTANSLNANPSGLNGELSHSSDPSQSELKSEIGVNPSSLLDLPGKISLAANQTHAPGSGLTILPLWNPRPKSGSQTQNLDPPGLLGLWTAGPHFSGIEPPQADTEDDGPCSETDHTKEIIAPSGMPITAPNGGAKAATISFMSLKSAPATNQEPTQGRGTGLQPGPMTMTLEQDNQVAKLGVLTNERTPRPSTILLPLDPST